MRLPSRTKFPTYPIHKPTMNTRFHHPLLITMLGASLALTPASLTAKPKKNQEPEVRLTGTGTKLERRYDEVLETLRDDITEALPKIDPKKDAAFKDALEKTKKAEAAAEVTQQALGKVHSGKGLVEHAKGKWIGGAVKAIAQAEADLEKAKTSAERKAAEKALTEAKKGKEEGEKALKERQADYDKALADEPKLSKANEAAKAELEKARADELAVATSLLSDIAPVLSTDKLDATLAKCAALTHATPRGLAAFAQQGPEQEALVEELFINDTLIVEMLVAGGAKYGEYGNAMGIFAAITKASPKASSGNLHRLALATALEHARPITQNNPGGGSDAPSTVDPVKRYLHYEKAYLAGELDPAFAGFTTWEYRHAINSDAPDETLAWGREMLRTYRPDHIYNADYGWRYVSTIRTEVPYGSQNVKYDDPSLQQHQNIICNGGICGRRAFFGRFILQSFGIPTWGVTQKAHAALSHWTPEGWVVNLGAGFQHSWWDKDEVRMSGTQFQLDSKARAHGNEAYLEVLRAHWISRILGEEQYNDRNKVDGGFWSGMARYKTNILASKAADLGPLGQDLAEANDREQKVVSADVSADDQEVSMKDGVVVIPAVAHGKTSGKAAAMNSFSGGMQMHFLGGSSADYSFELPFSGRYKLSAKVATAQKGQYFVFSTSASKDIIDTDVPYTIGVWGQMEPIEVTLERGRNTLHFTLKEGSKGVTIKEFTLTPVK